MHNTYRTTGIPDHVTLASSNRETWPFENPVMSTFHEVWSHMIAYWKGNLKIGFENLYTGSHIIIINHQFWAPCQNHEGNTPRKVRFSELQKLSDLELDLGSGQSYTGTHMHSRSTHTHQIRSQSEEIFVDRRTDIRADLSSNLLLSHHLAMT